ncbi:class II fructose-bisphosphate aldolase, partial [bacterium]|nr:class II fructose-bisphosphate aldolase [bacterium]
MAAVSLKDFTKALERGRPPSIVQLFPNSKALLVSGKVIDRAMIAKGRAMTIAANGRNQFVIRGALKAAQRANAAIIVEIAKSEGGAGAYCAVNFWNLARLVDSIANELHITVPVAIHADHYGIKGDADVEKARVEIPSMFDAGVTSIAVDASHLPDEQNLLASIELAQYVPGWAGLETEVGEIKGKEGLST